jgi:hypothetical protein
MLPVDWRSYLGRSHLGNTVPPGWASINALNAVQTHQERLAMQRVLSVFMLLFSVCLPITAFAQEKPLPTDTNGDRATSDQQVRSYGPLTFNSSDGADFYVAQNGKFAPASISNGTIEIHLQPGSFQIGYNGEQLNMCLAQSPFAEVRADPHGYKASCLSGAMTGAREANSDGLLVYSGKKWSDGNTNLSDETSMKAAPIKGYRFAYQVNKLEFVGGEDMPVSRFKGTLYGYIAVYKQDVRSNKDIMPIHLIFE